MGRQFALGKESTWPTAVARTRNIEAISENIRVEKTPIEVKTIRAPSTRAVESDQTRTIGDAEFVANYNEIGHLAYAYLGNVTTTGAGPYTHTIPGASGIDQTRKSFTIEVERDFTAFVYPGMVCTAFGLDVQRGQEARVRTSWQGTVTGITTGAATSIAYLTLAPTLPKEITVTVDAVTLKALNFRLDSVWPVDDPYVLGSTTYGVKPISNDVLGVAFTVEYMFENLTALYNAYVNDTTVDIQLDANSPTTDNLTINLNKCKITEHSAPTDGRQRYIATASGISFYDTDPTENMQIVVVNGQATVSF